MSIHEEADTRLHLQAFHAAESAHKSVIITAEGTVAQHLFTLVKEIRQ